MTASRPSANAANSAASSSKRCLGVLDEVHLVDRHDDVRDAEQRADERVALGLLGHAAARVHEHDCEVRCRGARDHVARVLLVARAVGDDEATLGRREVAVGDVDRDALLALGPQAVRQQRQVERAHAAAPLARLRHVLELVLEDLLGVEQQTADQRALAVVHGPGRGEAQQVQRHRAPSGLLRGHISARSAPHQKYPAFLRSSIAASDTLVVGARLTALGDPRRRDLDDDLLERARLRAARRPCSSCRRPCGSERSPRRSPRPRSAQCPRARRRASRRA